MKKGLIIGGVLIIFIALIYVGFQLMQTNAKLADTIDTLNARTAELNTLHIELEQTNTELNQTNDELNQTKNELNKINDELDRTASELNTTKEILNQTKGELDQTESDLTTAQAENSDLNDRLDEITVDLDAANSEIDSLNKDLDLYKETFGEVFAGVAPLAYLYDTQPPTVTTQIPLTEAPQRLFNPINNQEAVNPTYAELLAFLRSDRTDMYRYIDYYWVCGNFAETVHNNAEASGIRAAIVLIQYTVPPGHAINAFVTTDRGLVYIDCTGSETYGPSSMDGVVTNMKMHLTYNRVFLFPSGYYFIPEDKKITEIEIYW